MTFFNTLANLGNMWPDTFFLWLVEEITYKVITKFYHKRKNIPSKKDVISYV